MRGRLGVRALLAIATLNPLLAGQTRPAPLDTAAALIRAAAPSRDDADAIVADLLATATEHSRSASSALLLGEALRQVPMLRDPEAALAALQSYLDSSPHGLGAQAARAVRALCQEILGRESGARYPDLAREVVAIGPFGDYGDFFTGVPFPPELVFPAAGVALPGRYGAVRTRVVRRPAHRSRISLVEPRTGHRGCQYALHRVHTETAVSGYLELRCSGSFQVFLNGDEVARLNRNRGPAPETTFIPVALRPGRNHVLVKTTSSDADRFALRYTDGAGRTLDAVREVPADSELSGWSASGAAPKPEPLDDGFAALRAGLREARGEDLAAMRVGLAITAFRTGHPDDGLRALLDLEQEPPADPQSVLALAVAMQIATAIPAEVRAGRARQWIDGIGDRLGTHHHLLMERVRLLEDEDRREDAVRLLQAEVEAGRAGPRTFARLHGLLNGLSFAAEARRLLDTWAEALPTDSRAMLLLASARSRGGDTRGALTLLRDVQRKYPSSGGVNRRVAEIAADLGDEELALRAASALHGPEPDSLAAHTDRAVLWRRLGRSELELQAQREVTAHPDASAADLRRAADRILQLGDRSGAIAVYTDALQADPSQHRLRRLLVRLGGGEQGFPAIARFRREGDAVIAAFAVGDRDTSASTLVLDQMIVQVLEDGSSVREIHQVRRINDLRGVERFKDVDLPADSVEVLRLRTIATDGKSYVPNRVQGRFSMPRMEPGAFVESIYREYGGASGAAPWRGPLFFFQSAEEPYVLSELVVILPATARGSFRIRGFDGPTEEIELEDSLTARVFQRTDMPRLPAERFAPPLEELAPLVTFGEDVDAQATARAAHALALRRTYVTPYIVNQAREIAAGVEGDRARVDAVHRFVHEQIPDGGGSADPTTILLRGQGARFFLEAALLDALGVPLRHALAAGAREELRVTSSLFLGQERFEVPALLVEPGDGAPLWLFADSPRFWPLGAVVPERLGAPVLMLDEAGGVRTRLPDGDRISDLGYRMHAAVTLEQDGSASVAADLTLRGATGLDAAEQLRNLEETIRDLAARQLITGIMKGWTLRTVHAVDLQRSGAPLKLRGDLVRRGALRPAGDSWLLPLPVLKGDYVSTLGDRSRRRFPLLLTNTTSDSWAITVDPGEGYRFVEVPAPVQVQHQLLDYSLTFELQGRSLVVRRELYQKPGRIPASQFDAWLGLLEKLDQAESVNLRLIEK